MVDDECLWIYIYIYIFAPWTYFHSTTSPCAQLCRCFLSSLKPCTGDVHLGQGEDRTEPRQQSWLSEESMMNNDECEHIHIQYTYIYSISTQDDPTAHLQSSLWSLHQSLGSWRFMEIAHEDCSAHWDMTSWDQLRSAEISWGYIKFVDGNPLDSAFNADPQQVSSKAMGDPWAADAMMMTDAMSHEY